MLASRLHFFALVVSSFGAARATRFGLRRTPFCKLALQSLHRIFEPDQPRDELPHGRGVTGLYAHS